MPPLLKAVGPPPGARLAKACDNCHKRKVRCDGSVPVCYACLASNLTQCNVESNIVFRLDYVRSLEERIEWLEKAVAEAYEEGSAVKGIATGSELSSKTTAHMVRDARMVEEIGLLSLRGAGAYMGSMTGITLAALVNATLELYATPVSMPSDPPRQLKRRHVRAAYPPRAIATKYIFRYIDEIHRWYPFVSLSSLVDTLQAVYTEDPMAEHPEPSEGSRFVLLMLFALTAAHGKQDPHGPGDYYRSALDFLHGALHERSLTSCRALLLLCLYSLRIGPGHEEETMDSWLLTGHAVRLGIELGLTRNNYKAGLTEEEHEARRRIWWSTYSLERFVATATGRVLGIRNEGIDAAHPKTLLEEIPPRLKEFLYTDADLAINLRPALHLFTQRKLLGDVMESVYITRARSRPSPSPEETLAKVYQIQNSVVAWAENSLHLTSRGSTEYAVLQLAFHQVTLLLHRPSPSFPAPPPDVLDICMGAARGTIRIAGEAVKNGSVSRVIPGWPGFVAVFMSGLTLAYCSWAGPSCSNAVQSGLEPGSDLDIASSITTLKSLSGGSALCARYIAIYESIITNLCRIIDSLPWATHSALVGDAGADRETIALVTENAGLQPIGGWELDQHAVLLMDDLLSATTMLGQAQPATADG